MRFTVQLEWTDYLQAQYLQMRPHNLRQTTSFFFFGCLELGLAAAAIISLLDGDQVGALGYLAPVIILAAMALLQFYVLLPRQARRQFTPQAWMSVPVQFDITSAGLAMSSRSGTADRPWSDLTRWKENKNIMLLFISNTQYVAFPKRFCTIEQLAAIRAYLRQNKVTDAGRYFRGLLIALAIYAGMLVIACLSFYLR